MSLLLRLAQAGLFSIVLCLPASAQDADQEARQLLVDAIKAYQAAQATNDISEKARLLGDSKAALEAIERDYVTTDTGIGVLSGQTFGAFDPAHVAPEYDAVSEAAHQANCEATYSAECSYELRNQYYAELNGIPLEDAIADYGAIDRIAYVLTVGGDWISEASEVLPLLTEDETWELYTAIYNYGFGPELLEIHDLLPGEHPLRTNIPDRAKLVSALPFLNRQPYAGLSARARRSLERLVAADTPGIEAAVFAAGSRDQIRTLFEAEDDPTAKFSALFEQGAFPQESAFPLGADEALSALIEMGESDFVVDYVRDHLPDINKFTTVPWIELNPQALARATREVLPQPLSTRNQHRLVFAAVAHAPIDGLGHLLDWVSRETSIERGEDYELWDLAPIATYAGLQAGRAGDPERGRILEEHGAQLFNPNVTDAFLNGLAIGLLVAPSPSGDLLQSRMDTDDLEDFAKLAGWASRVLVSEGRLGDAKTGLSTVLSVDLPDHLARKRAAIYAVVGNLAPLIDALRGGSILSNDFYGVVGEYREFLLAAEEHGYDTSDAPGQIASVMGLYTSQEDILSNIAMSIIFNPDPRHPLRGEALYQASIDLYGNAKRYALDGAHEAKLGPAE